MRQQPITGHGGSGIDAVLPARRLSDARRAAPDWSQAGRHAVLARTVREEVIPRLLLARQPQRLTRAAVQPPEGRGDQVAQLASMLLLGSQADVTAYVEAIGDGGLPVEQLLLDLLAPTARLLGRMWEDDTCSFSDVTLGLTRLANVMRLLGRAFDPDRQAVRSGPSALLVRMPGEQHGFGLAMVAQFFCRAGWNVRQEPVVTDDELIGLVRNTWFGVVGISVASSERMEALSATIGAIRRHSRNGSVGVMVGGPPFLALPQLAAMVGADATAADANQAVRQAQRLVSSLARAQ